MNLTEQLADLDISDTDFNELSQLVYQRFGIHLTPQKRSLVVGRLRKVLRKHRMNSFTDYLRMVKETNSDEVLSELINQISTNHTYFFREPEHFVFMREVILPEVQRAAREKGERDFRCWSAGCSSGEEPYTIAMVVHDFFGSEYSQWHAGVLATDISAKVLEQAQAGVYPRERLGATPETIAKRYCDMVDADHFTIKDSVRHEVTFRRLNLMRATFPFKKPFHLISCRNVMIYFDEPTRAELVRKFHGSLAPGGYLFIGHSETLGRVDRWFDYVKPAIYQKKS